MNKIAIKQWFMRKLVQFVTENHKVIEINGDKIAIVLLDDIIKFSEIVGQKDYANKL